MTITHQEEGRRERLDYSKRHRKAEWRHNWFRLRRLDDDYELLRVIDEALRLKKEKIEKQKKTANHLAAYAPAGAGTPWFCVGPRNVNGRVKSIAVHPTNQNILYAGAASGGVWKTEDGGQSWRPLWDEQESLAIGSIAIAPSAPNTIYAGTGEWTPGLVAELSGGRCLRLNGCWGDVDPTHCRPRSSCCPHSGITDEFFTCLCGGRKRIRTFHGWRYHLDYHPCRTDLGCGRRRE